MVGARMLGASVLEENFKLVQELHRLEGSLPRGLGDYSYGLYEQLMGYARQRLTTEQYEAFYRAY